MEKLTIGVLALQGAFQKHIEMIKALGENAIAVRKPEDLAHCDALIIPGGESTTIFKQMKFIEFMDAFREFSSKKPVFGTCAGLILMSKEILEDSMQPFNLLDISVERNAFGRQVESFQTDIPVSLTSTKTKSFPAVFIRAPRIKQVGPEIKILAQYEGEPVLVQQAKHLGATFHPELTNDSSIHAYFIRQIRATK